jgi:hypothetical protein
MERRVSERKAAHLPVRFSYANSFFNGVVKNLTGSGMCISTSMLLPCDSSAKLYIPFRHKVLEISVIVRRIERTNNFFDIMGLEIVNPSVEYKEFIDILWGQA